MKYLFVIIILALAPSTGAEGNQFVRIGADVEVPLPENWYLGTDTSGFPAQLIHRNDSAEILLFRSEIVDKDMIGSQDELRQSVELVVEDVITTLKGGRLRTSTGFYDGFRAGFVLEFVSSDSLSGVLLEHRLMGILYRHADDYQTLFTVWGKAAEAAYSEAKPAIQFVQDGLVFRGEYESEVFRPASTSYWPFILVGVALVGLLLLRPRKRKTASPPSPPTASDS